MGVVKLRRVPWATTIGGLLPATSTGIEPLKLPQRWLDAKAALDPKIPLNFISTSDIIGGNSGSPVVDASGALVGLIFDGNITSLANRYVYADATQRAVSVDSAAIPRGAPEGLWGRVAREGADRRSGGSARGSGGNGGYKITAASAPNAWSGPQAWIRHRDSALTPGRATVPIACLSPT